MQNRRHDSSTIPCFRQLLSTTQSMGTILAHGGKKIAIFVVLSLALLLMAEITCVTGCGRTFVENKHLSRHKKTCQHVQQHRQKSREARKEGRHTHGLKDIPTLLDRKKRLQVRNFV
jgi:predicted metalloprotease